MLNSSAASQPVFSFPIRIYYEDTDCGGVVYHSNYLKYLERARSEFLRSLGVEQDALIDTHGIIFAVRSVNINYLLPARFNDMLDVTVARPRGGRATLEFEQTIARDGTPLANAQVTIVCLDSQSLRPRRIPAFLLPECSIEH